MARRSYLDRLATVGRALRIAKEKTRRQRWSRDRLLELQRARLGALVAHASRRSVFYRRLYGGEVAAHEVEISRLPVTTKGAMMSAFDEVMTEPGLRLAPLTSHLSRAPEQLFRDQFTLLSTGGSSGIRGVYAFSRTEWDEVMGTYFACADLIGVRPTLPRQRILVAAAPDARHLSFRQSDTADIGLHRAVRLSASCPIDELVATADRIRPHGLIGYPSVLARLAREQVAGRIRIAPRWVITTAELRTEDMTRQIRAAWGVDPFTTYGMTEAGSVASDCSAHAGLHVLEDGVILENVDRDGRPVPPGTPGAKLLVTNLWLYTQPVIRFEISDMLVFDERPCRCGRTSKRIIALDGRSDDLLELPAGGGSTVTIHPAKLRSVLGAIPAVAQYQIIQDGHVLTVQILPTRDEAHGGLDAAVREQLEAVLGQVGVVGVTARVRLVEHLERSGGGKLKLVIRR